MFTWEKKGRIFIPQDIKNRAWLNEFAQAPAVLKFDDFIRVYFSCRPNADEKGQYVSYSSYVDFKRNNLHEIINIAEKPVMSLGELGTFDEFGTYPFSAIRTNDKVVAYYGGWTRCESVPFNVAIGRAESSDEGKTFSRTGEGPVLSYSPDEPFVISGPKIRLYNNRWCLWYIAGKKWIDDKGRPEPVYRIRMAFSDDGLVWEKVNRDLVETKVEEDECQASPDVFFWNNKYHMFFCYRYSRNYRGKEGGYRIGYAHSEDMLNWTRDDSKAGIDISDEGWDSEMISYPHVFELDGKIYMMYLGNHVGKYGFGLAELKGSL